MYEEEPERSEAVDICISDVRTSKQLHQILKKELGFPDFYGMNWDAFWDAVTGLVEMPKIIIFHGWENATCQLPADVAIMKELLEKLNEKHPSWGCKVEYR